MFSPRQLHEVSLTNLGAVLGVDRAEIVMMKASGMTDANRPRLRQILNELVPDAAMRLQVVTLVGCADRFGRVPLVQLGKLFGETLDNYRAGHVWQADAATAIALCSGVLPQTDPLQVAYAGVAHGARRVWATDDVAFDRLYGMVRGSLVLAERESVDRCIRKYMFQREANLRVHIASADDPKGSRLLRLAQLSHRYLTSGADEPEPEAPADNVVRVARWATPKVHP